MERLRRNAATWVLLGLLAGLGARGEATGDRAAADFDVAEAVSRAQARAVQRVRPFVVSVQALGGENEEFGAGIVVDRSGLVLTALHVVEGAKALAVRLSDGSEWPANVSAKDAFADLALLRLAAPGRDFEAAPLGDDRTLEVGESVLAVGNPFGLGGSVSRGIVSARDRRHVVPDNVAALLQTDAAINPGSSGGAIVNLRGEVVGMITAILTRSGGSQGIGFAIPAGEIRHALRFLREGRPVVRAWMGVKLREVGEPEQSLEVVETVERGPAAEGGLRPGDRILRLHGQRITTIPELRAFLRDAEVGERLRVGYRRADRLLECEVLLGRLADKT